MMSSMKPFLFLFAFLFIVPVTTAISSFPVHAGFTPAERTILEKNALELIRSAEETSRRYQEEEHSKQERYRERNTNSTEPWTIIKIGDFHAKAHPIVAIGFYLVFALVALVVLGFSVGQITYMKERRQLHTIQPKKALKYQNLRG